MESFATLYVSGVVVEAEAGAGPGEADEAARWTEAQYRSAALETFRALAPLYRLRA